MLIENPFKASAASAAFTQKIGRCAIEKFQDVANACSISMSDANCTLEDEPGTQADGYVPQLWTKEKQLRLGYSQFQPFRENTPTLIETQMKEH